MNKTLERLRTRGDESGFTLIEILIVIVILAILAAIIVLAVQSLSGSASEAACKSDLKNVETAVEAYKAQMGEFPTGGMTAATSTSAPTGGPAGATDSDPISATINAASAGSEMLTGSYSSSAATAPYGLDAYGGHTANAKAPYGTPVGPWLKTPPINASHYTIWVSNDGTGTVTVGTGHVTSQPTATNCNAVT